MDETTVVVQANMSPYAHASLETPMHSQNNIRGMQNMLQYMSNSMNLDMIKFERFGKLKSGYKNLDCITNLYPGLYVIGAISSLGKTTFVHQMSDQMALAGNPILFFSLEQTMLELSAKSLSRTMAISDATTAMTSLQIRKNHEDLRIQSAFQQYSQAAKNLNIVEGNFQMSIDDIEQTVVQFISNTGTIPVVVIDYLQVIQPSSGNRLQAKDLVDMHVSRIKRLQSTYHLVLIVISSLNRQNYMTQIDYESFKESGGIEYTADVLWGLQLSVIHDDLFDKQGHTNEKRLKIREAKSANPRRIELVCLKNRYGISSYCCLFDYYPQYDYFVPIVNDDTMLDYLGQEADPDGFVQLPDGFDLPFD